MEILVTIRREKFSEDIIHWKDDAGVKRRFSTSVSSQASVCTNFLDFELLLYIKEVLQDCDKEQLSQILICRIKSTCYFEKPDYIFNNANLNGNKQCNI